MKHTLLCVFISILSMNTIMAQLPHDQVYMNKNIACGALMYGNSSWTNYWENTLKRDNPNIGKLSTESLGAMIAYGITKKINALVMVPYVKTQASKGNLMGQQGLQDVSLWLKAQVFDYKQLHGHATLGVSTPMSNYVTEFMPMSIGIGAKTFSARAILHYNLPSNLFISATGSYILRSNVNVDRDSFLNGERLYNTSTVAVPNAFNAMFRMGYLRKENQVEVFAEHFSCVGGDNIRRNSMPFLTNDMTMTAVGAYAKYQPKSLGISAKVSYVLDGQNAGQSTNVTVGLLYLFKVK
ncbi:hypothetical protein HME7025_02563 [Aquirufa nivalisilvae]|uniref:Transporter n=1 Tax=Aquirufa nivalisilvae TaxID=2516557 RepID=A0A2S2DYJ7_9BACT|nr:hypothetical protein [Aquirufa nivalisilvae]AWL10403.1 hypothetical protein HME7025_02563 [Aquirufa nivalisilvae]